MPPIQRFPRESGAGGEVRDIMTGPGEAEEAAQAAGALLYVAESETWRSESRGNDEVRAEDHKADGKTQCRCAE